VNLEEIQALVAVVDHGSVLAAAEALGVARTTLRRRLDDLEARAGVPLLHRMASGAAVTEAGRVVVDQGRRMLREASALLASVREIGGAPTGVVRVVAPPGMAPHLAVPLTVAVRTRFPGIVLDVRFDTDPIGGLLTDVDLAIQFGATLPEGPWVAFVVHRIPERLVASPAWLAAHGTPTSLAELAAHPVHAWAAPDRDPRALPLVGGGTCPFEPAMVCSDIHLLHHLALGGHGLALVPDALIPDPSVEGQVVPVLPDVVGRTLAVRIVVPEALIDVPKIKALVDVVRLVAAQLPPG
jgi:DNA-binding transcriptional LysR family regulator